jgi:sec-independent protein translocase protein TatB
MFDVGFFELVLIMVVALLVVGPERLPVLARKAGRWVGQARAYFNSVRSDIERELKTEELRQMLSRQEEEIRKLKDIVHDTTAEVEKEVAQTEYMVKAIDDKQQSSTSVDEQTSSPALESSHDTAVPDERKP